MIKQVHVFIKGDVVGVGFRYWTKTQAEFLNLKGWVKNVNNYVEAVIQGEKQNVNRLIELLKKGPIGSRVDEVKVLSKKTQEVFDGFQIIK